MNQENEVKVIITLPDDIILFYCQVQSFHYIVDLRVVFKNSVTAKLTLIFKPWYVAKAKWTLSDDDFANILKILKQTLNNKKKVKDPDIYQTETSEHNASEFKIWDMSLPSPNCHHLLQARPKTDSCVLRIIAISKKNTLKTRYQFSVNKVCVLVMKKRWRFL